MVNNPFCTFVRHKDLFSQCELIRSFQRSSSHLLKQSLIENFIFWAAHCLYLIISRYPTTWPLEY